MEDAEQQQNQGLPGQLEKAFGFAYLHGDKIQIEILIRIQLETPRLQKRRRAGSAVLKARNERPDLRRDMLNFLVRSVYDPDEVILQNRDSTD